MNASASFCDFGPLRLGGFRQNQPAKGGRPLFGRQLGRRKGDRRQALVSAGAMRPLARRRGRRWLGWRGRGMWAGEHFACCLLPLKNVITAGSSRNTRQQQCPRNHGKKCRGLSAWNTEGVDRLAKHDSNKTAR